MVTISTKLQDISEHPLFTTLLMCMSDGVLIANEAGEVLCVNSAFKEHLGADNNDADDLCIVKSMGLHRLLDIAGNQPCSSQRNGARPQSIVERLVRVKEKIRSGTTARDMEFHCGTIDVPDTPHRLQIVITRDPAKNSTDSAGQILKNSAFITNAPEMLSIISRLEQVSNSTAPVMLTGESGTGKTQIARMIHKLSPRADKPLVEVNCAAIPDQLLESELFGHVKGAFTGATQQRLGRFQAANGGGLLLDEIGEIPLHLQAKLLRAIQDQKFEPVGSDETIEVDVRVISATNQNLRDMVNAGKFRADLFYRLAVVPINIPPLRERVGDIPLLLTHFCEDLTARGYPDDVNCTPEAMRMMMDYPWPGNVREMISAVEYAYICAIDKSVVPDSLPQDIRRYVQQDGSLGPVDIADAFTRAGVQSPPSERANQSLAQSITDALKEAGGNKTHAAKRLGIDRTTLWRRMRKVGLA